MTEIDEKLKRFVKKKKVVGLANFSEMSNLRKDLHLKDFYLLMFDKN